MGELDGSLFELEDQKMKGHNKKKTGENCSARHCTDKGISEERAISSCTGGSDRAFALSTFYFASLLFCMPFCLTICFVVHVCVGISEERATSSCTGGSDRAYISCAAGLDSICVCIWRRSVVLWSTEPNATWPAHMERMFNWL